jgi:Flp pilus assembly protein TadD
VASVLLPAAILVLGMAFSPNVNAESSAPAARSSDQKTSAEPEAAQLLREGYQKIAHGDLDGALATVNFALRSNADNAEALVLRGSVYAQQSQWAKAQADYETAKKLQPQAASASP